MPLPTWDGRVYDGQPPSEPILNPTVVAEAQSVLDHQPYIEDAAVNKTAFNPQTYAEQFQLLQRYAAGSRIECTYFLLSNPTSSGQRSEAIDPSAVRNAVHTSYSQINNFEIVMQNDGLASSFNPVNSETKVIGEALLYPGIQPRLGDQLVIPIGDATFGIFQVTSVERLSYRQGSTHKIGFLLREYGSDQAVATIKASVTQVFWFDREIFFTQELALLTSESAIFLKTMRQMRRLLIHYYYNTFYDKEVGSIMSPRGHYDPYLVHYLNTKISIEESIQRPTQLYPAMQNYENTIWSRLTDITNRKLTSIQSAFHLATDRVTRWDVSITALVNRTLTVIENPTRASMRTQVGVVEESCPLPTGPFNWWSEAYPTLSLSAPIEGYVLSTNFYTGDKTMMTPFEVLVYSVIYTRRVFSIRDFIEGYLNTYTELSFEEQYHFIPLYLWLIDVALSQIAAPNPFMT